MHINSVLEAPGYAEALFEAMLRIGGAESPRATRTDVTSESSIYLLTWTER
jgi:uncharacterized protein (TIGR02265 family)